MSVSQRKFRVEVFLLLAFMALLAGGSAYRESATIDEIAHFGAGVSYLQKLDMRMNEEHPPLAKVAAALPAVLHGAHADYTDFSWTFSGDKFFNQYLGEWVFGDSVLFRWNDPLSTLRVARAPMLLITLMLGFVISYYGSRLGDSSWAGLLCLTAFVTMPVFLAFGPLVITDIAVTLFWILATWQLARMWQSPLRSQVLLFGLTLAGAFLSKFSAGLFLFVIPAVALSLRVRPLPEQPSEETELRKWRRRAWRNILIGILWSVLVVYFVYLVLSWHEPTTSFSVIPHFPASPILRRALMPIWIYLRGLIGFALSAGSRPTFILGHSYPHGVWFYFPVLFLLKSPLAFLLLLVLAGGAAIVVKRQPTVESLIPSGMEMQWRCLWVSLTVYTAACLLSRLDISIRHFTVPLALIILLLAPLLRALEVLRQRQRQSAQALTLTTLACAAGLVVTAIAAYPYYFPFANTLKMGRPTYLLFNDSNVDWNQSLIQVKRFADQRGLNRILLDPYSFSEPAAYVPQAQLWDCQQPSPSDGGQWAVVSANLIADGSNCQWLFKYLHLELANGSMYAFLLPKEIPAAGTPEGPPLPQDYHYFGGMKVAGGDIRQVFRSCIRDPKQLEPTMNRLMALAKEQQKNRSK